MTALIIFTLCACSDEPDEEQAGKDMEQVLTELFSTVQEQDKNAFISFFDDDVSAQPDFENGMDYVFSSYKGDIQSVTCKFPLGVRTDFEPGERIYRAFGTFNVVTSENEYVVYLEFFTRYESKYPNEPYKIKIFKILEKQAFDNGENFHDCSLRNGIYYPGWLGVENIEGNESKLNDRLSIIYSEYDKAEIIKYFYVKNGEQHIDTFCLVDVGDRLDLSSVITYNGGATFDFISLVEDMQPLHDYSVTSIVGNRKISFYVSDKPLNASDFEEIIEYSHNKLNYWFGIKSIDCFD
jgi:hypothetical protein